MISTREGAEIVCRLGGIDGTGHDTETAYDLDLGDVRVTVSPATAAHLYRDLATFAARDREAGNATKLAEIALDISRRGLPI